MQIAAMKTARFIFCWTGDIESYFQHAPIDESFGMTTILVQPSSTRMEFSALANRHDVATTDPW